MEIVFLKSHALDTLKTALPKIFPKYFTEADNAWLVEVCGENPFGKFKTIPDFELAPLNSGLTEGEIDFRNCKIVYEKLNFLSEAQASDERLWAGLCHGAFYDYVRRRYSYDSKPREPDIDKNVKHIRQRFFFQGESQTGILRNTLSKCWWTGRAFFDATRSNPFEKLDILGANDIGSKISYILRYSFAANPTVLNGVVKFFKHFNDRNIKLGDLKESLRPALIELNKRGGATILDCLSEDDVAAILIECVEKIFSRKFVSEPAPAEHAEKILDTRTVKFGSEIKVVSLDNGKQRNYKISRDFKKKFPDIYAELIGKRINSEVTIRDEKFTITEIKQEPNRWRQ